MSYLLSSHHYYWTQLHMHMKELKNNNIINSMVLKEINNLAFKTGPYDTFTMITRHKDA